MREFRQKHGRSGERYWQIDKKGKKSAQTVVWTAWGGIVDGKRKQHGETKDKPGPKGKKNTKAWVSAADNATFHHDRMIRKKLEEGYIEVGLDGRPLLGGSADIIDHNAPLPKNLCFSKPRNSVTDAFIEKLELTNNVLWTRKVNGMLVIAHIMADGEVRLYSRRMDDVTLHFPHLVHALGPGLKIPSRSILLFEAFYGDGNTEEEFLQVQSVMRSKVDRALDIQAESGFLKFYLIRVPVWKGEDLETIHTCHELVSMIENFFADRFISYREPGEPEQFLYTLEILEEPLPEVMALGEYWGYEGWVGYAKDGCFMVEKGPKGQKTMVNMSYSFHGKPDRPPCTFKKKLEAEDDFIAYFAPDDKEFKQGTWGTGKNTGKVGTLSLYQLNENGEQVYICEVGSGLTDEMRENLLSAAYPSVVEVRYQSRTYGRSNALRHPRVVRFRTDKDPKECTNDQLKASAP